MRTRRAAADGQDDTYGARAVKTVIDPSKAFINKLPLELLRRALTDVLDDAPNPFHKQRLRFAYSHVNRAFSTACRVIDSHCVALDGIKAVRAFETLAMEDGSRVADVTSLHVNTLARGQRVSGKISSSSDTIERVKECIRTMARFRNVTVLTFNLCGTYGVSVEQLDQAIEKLPYLPVVQDLHLELNTGTPSTLSVAKLLNRFASLSKLTLISPAVAASRQHRWWYQNPTPAPGPDLQLQRNFDLVKLGGDALGSSLIHWLVSSRDDSVARKTICYTDLRIDGLRRAHIQAKSMAYFKEVQIHKLCDWHIEDWLSMPLLQDLRSFSCWYWTTPGLTKMADLCSRCPNLESVSLGYEASENRWSDPTALFTFVGRLSAVVAQLQVGLKGKDWTDDRTQAFEELCDNKALQLVWLV